MKYEKAFVGRLLTAAGDRHPSDVLGMLRTHGQYCDSGESRRYRSRSEPIQEET